MAIKILLIEDDAGLRTTLKEALLVEGYEVNPSASIADASALLRSAMPSQEPFNLVILDLGLPDGQGDELLLQIRSQYALLIIIISAQHEDSKKVNLLDAGADDYLVKPFSISELFARMRVALRHRGVMLKPAITHYSIKDIEIDLTQYEVTKKNQLIHLTPTEFQLLARLVRQAGKVVTHRQLLLDVWGPEFINHTHYLRLYMAQLRSKLEDNLTEPEILLTETGVGYKIAEVLPKS